MWLHLLATAGVTGLAIFLRLTAFEWLWIILAIGAVWTAEAFNTAIERLADVVSQERDPRIGAVKDLAAAGVLIAAVFALLVGLIIFLPNLIALLGDYS